MASIQPGWCQCHCYLLSKSLTLWVKPAFEEIGKLPVGFDLTKQNGFRIITKRLRKGVAERIGVSGAGGKLSEIAPKKEPNRLDKAKWVSYNYFCVWDCNNTSPKEEQRIDKHRGYNRIRATRILTSPQRLEASAQASFVALGLFQNKHGRRYAGLPLLAHQMGGDWRSAGPVRLLARVSTLIREY